MKIINQNTTYHLLLEKRVFHGQRIFKNQNLLLSTFLDKQQIWRVSAYGPIPPANKISLPAFSAKIYQPV